MTPLAVAADIAPQDAMFHGNETHYFGVGRSALTCIEAVRAVVGQPPVDRLLDLGCGHGRVMRALRATFPDAEIVGADVDADGVAFCAERFDAVPVVTSTDPAALPLAGPFDLVWSGSVLTHLDRGPFLALLRTVTDVLGPRGLAVVTTHGRRVATRIRNGQDDYGLGADVAAELLAEATTNGFAYRDYSHSPGYGISLCEPSWLLATVADELPDVRISAFMEAAWDDHQDVLALALVP